MSWSWIPDTTLTLFMVFVTLVVCMAMILKIRSLFLRLIKAFDDSHVDKLRREGVPDDQIPEAMKRDEEERLGSNLSAVIVPASFMFMIGLTIAAFAIPVSLPVVAFMWWRYLHNVNRYHKGGYL